MNLKALFYLFFSLLLNHVRSQNAFIDSCEKSFVEERNFNTVVEMVNRYSHIDKTILDDCRVLYMFSVSYDRMGIDSSAKKWYEILTTKIEEKKCNKSNSHKPISTFMILNTYLNFANIYLRKGKCDSAISTLEKAKPIQLFGGSNDILEGKRKIELAFVEVSLCQGDTNMALKQLFASVLNYRYGESKLIVDKAINLLLSKYSINLIINEYQNSLKNIKLITKVEEGKSINQYQTTFFDQVLWLYNFPVMIWGDEHTPSINEIKQYYLNNLFYNSLQSRKQAIQY